MVADVHSLTFDVVASLPSLVEILSYTVPAPDPSLIPTPAPTNVTVELTAADKSWFELLVTSPVVVAAGAVTAACVVLRGTNKHVKKLEEANGLSRNGNLETERKNKEDQWWSTLKWAYEQASKTADTTSNDFKERAVLGIFESLATPGISSSQLAALENIKSVFKEKDDPSTAAGVANFERAIEATKSGSAPIGLRQTQASLQYRKDLITALTWASPQLGITRVYAHQQGAPILFRTDTGKLIGLAPLHVGMDTDLKTNLRDVAKEMHKDATSKEFLVTTKGGGLGETIPEDKLDLFVVVTNAKLYWPQAGSSGDDVPRIFYPEPSGTSADNPEKDNDHQPVDGQKPDANTEADKSPSFADRVRLLRDELTKLISAANEDGRAQGTEV